MCFCRLSQAVPSALTLSKPQTETARCGEGLRLGQTARSGPETRLVGAVGFESVRAGPS